MFTKLDKALVGLIVPLILYGIDYLVKNYGVEMPPNVRAAVEQMLIWLLPILTGAVVYFVPNKTAK